MLAPEPISASMPRISRLATRLSIAVPALVAALAACAVAAAPAAGASTAERYWEFVDRRMAEMHRYWSDRGFYDAVAGMTTRTNANALAVHSLAALAGREGPARADARARLLVTRLLQPPAWTDRGTTGQRHANGWTSGLDAPGNQHVSIDPQVIEGLVAAWRARVPLGLVPAQADLLSQRVRAAAHSSFFRWPAIRLNQFNWHGELYAADWTVNGDATLLRHDYRRQLRRFAVNATRPSPIAPWLNRGRGLNYVSVQRTGQGANAVSTSEYGGIVLGGIRHYTAAVEAARMAPLDSSSRRMLRAYAQRQLLGEWTHAGYLNWDTGLGFLRWHLLRYWPLAASGLIAVATDRRIVSQRDRGIAAYLIDRALATYERWDGAGLMQPTAFGIEGLRVSPADRQNIVTRWAVIAARAAISGVTAVVPRAPDAWFAHDPDIGRLAVSTRRYSTAIAPAHASGYGGVELARLHDTASGEPVSNIGGRGPAAFGLRLTDRRGATVLDTQPGRPLRHSGWRLDAAGSRGAFRSLSARTVVRTRRASVTVRHSFGLGSVRTDRWIRAQAPLTAVVRFPLWEGKPSAPARSGLATAGQTLDLDRYRVRLHDLPGATEIGLLAVRPQPSSPRTRSTVTLRFAVPAGRTVHVAHSVLAP